MMVCIHSIWDKVFKNGSSEICGFESFSAKLVYGVWVTLVASQSERGGFHRYSVRKFTLFFPLKKLFTIFNDLNSI